MDQQGTPYQQFRYMKFGYNNYEMKNIKHIILGVLITSVIVLTSYVWFATAGTWKIWPTSTNYYNLLANAFIQGQVSLDLEVPQELLALSNPYKVSERKNMDYLWDASLYKGRYYLYWGPLPAIAIAGIKLLHPQDISDNLIVFAAAVGLFIFQVLLATRIWLRSFQQLPAWTLFIGILLTGLVVPINWMIHRPAIYEAAIMSAQFFLIGGIYFAYRAFEKGRILSGWLAWASVCWVCAIASRVIVIFPVIFLLLLILIRVLRTNGTQWNPTFVRAILGLGIPMAIAAIGLGWYNFARFESVSDFGFEYALTIYNAREHKSDIFRSEYILPNTYYYLINPPTKISSFPYFRAQSSGEPEAFGIQAPKLYYTEKVTGAIYVVPFLVFAFVPLVAKITQMVKTKKDDSSESEKDLSWAINALGGATVVAAITLFTYVFSMMRYYADVTPMLIAFSVVGFWYGHQAIKSSLVGRFAYTSLAVLLASISIIVPNLLALYSSQRLVEHSPQVFASLDAFFKSFVY
jgi:hypothetical protein